MSIKRLYFPGVSKLTIGKILIYIFPCTYSIKMLDVFITMLDYLKIIYVFLKEDPFQVYQLI